MSAPAMDHRLPAPGEAAGGSRGWWGHFDGPGRLVAFGLSVMFFSLPLSISGMHIGLGAAIVGVLWDMAARRRRLQRTPLDLPIILFLIVTFLSSVFSSRPLPSLQQFLGNWSVVAFYLVVTYARRDDFLRFLLKLLFWPASAAALYAILQHFTGWDFFTTETVAMKTLALGGHTVYFPHGTFSHYQTFANVFFILFCLSFSFAVGREDRGRRLIWWVPALLIGASLVFSFTRGIWVAMMIAVIIIGAFQSRRAFYSVTALLLAAILYCSFSTSVVATRARSIVAIEENVERLLIWETTWNMIRDYPLLGVGQGNYRRVQDAYIREEVQIPISRTHSHNILLQITVERGVVALLLFLWMWYLIVKEGFLLLWRLRVRRGHAFSLVLGCTTGVIGFFWDGLFQNNFGDTEVVLLFWVVVGVNMLTRDRLRGGELLSEENGEQRAEA